MRILLILIGSTSRLLGTRFGGLAFQPCKGLLPSGSNGKEHEDEAICLRAAYSRPPEGMGLDGDLTLQKSDFKENDSYLRPRSQSPARCRRELRPEAGSTPCRREKREVLSRGQVPNRRFGISLRFLDIVLLDPGDCWWRRLFWLRNS